MSASEFKLRKLIEDSTFFILNAEEDETYHEKAKACLDEADLILLSNTRESYIDLSAEVVVKLAEVSLLSKKRDESAERILDIFFQRVQQEDQFFCQALLAQATIEERKVAKFDKKGDANLKQLKHAFTFVQRAIEITTKAETKAKYQFLVYNASIKTWHILRSLMRPGWSKHTAEIFERISNLLEEADDSDLNWRCRYMSALCKALVDNEKKPESLKILDKLVDLTKKKGDCNFQEVLFRTRVHMYRDNNAMLANIKKETESGDDANAFKSLYVIQSIHSEIIPASQVEKELQLLMSTIAPMSVSDDPSAQAQSAKLSPILQDRIAECGRIAIKFNLIQYAEGACVVVARARQGSLRAKVWSEYIKAELLLKKPSPGVNPKTGMKLNTLQRQQEDFERRVEALRVMDRSMIANKRLQDPDLIIEGSILIWNTGIPLLKKSARNNVYKPFLAAAQALEQIESNDCLLRVCLHLELAKYEIEQDFLSKATLQLKKALQIDYSVVQKQLGFELKEEDNPEDFQRTYDKTLKFLLKKLSLKTNIYGGDPESVHEQIILDVENAKTTKNSKMRQMLLDKAVKALQEFEIPEFQLPADSNLVEEEIVAAKRKFQLQQVRERKERVLVCAEISSLAIDEMLIEIAMAAATLGIAEQWDPIKDADLVIAQSTCHIQLAKCYVEYLLSEDIEIGHKELVTLMEDQDDREFTDQQKQTFMEQKVKFTQHIVKAVQLGQQTKQSWLIFNASIEFWNQYLPIFKKFDFQQHVHPTGTKTLAECFEAMNGAFVSGDFASLDWNKVDYELEKKMQTFTNISMLLARMYEFQNSTQEAVRICDILLTKQLPSHIRKTFDSIRARITKQVSKLGEQTATQAKQAAAPAKGAKAGQVVEVKEVKGPNKVDIITSEVLSFLELIQNGQKEMIQKALDTLNLWVPSEQEEIELEMNVELWCRLGRLAMSQNTTANFKIALYCADASLKNGDSKAKSKQYMQIPITRLRWYAVAEALYGEALYRMLDTQKQEKESQDRLLHASVARLVESCNIAAKAGISYLVLESAKQMWNSMIGILDAAYNRKLLIEPMCRVHSYLLQVQEASDPDFLTLYYTALFQTIAEQQDWKIGEKIVEEAFKYMPNSHHKVLWEAKMNFLSKLGKNVLSAISNMKESNASLMAKVWVRLARSSQQELEQHQAYNKAIEILRKEESIEVVEVLIEYAEWMHRNQYTGQDVEDQLLLAVDLLMDIEPTGWDDEDEEIGPNADEEAKTRKTGNSKSSKQSKALTKKSKIGGRSIKQSIAGKTTKSKLSKASLRSKSLMSSGSRQTKKTTTSFSKRQEEDANPTFMNCSHYDKLIRIHSMLAMLVSDSQKQREYALDCHYFIMKMWEQSFVSLNATLFFEQHQNQFAELGYKPGDDASRKEYFSEVMTSNDFQIPVKFHLPEKPDEWTTFEVPAELLAKGEIHEDKAMIGKWTFQKPELTYLHLRKVADILDGQYFSIQLLPVLYLMEVFAGSVLGNTALEYAHALQRSRLILNMGLKGEGHKLYEKIDSKRYLLSEEERKVQYEKIKQLKDESFINQEAAIFVTETASEANVIEQVRIHEAWTLLSEELLRWGEFTRAKELAKEASIHCRVLNDPNNYTRCLVVLSKLALVEGDTGSALQIALASHQSVREMQQVEQCILHTFDMLFEFQKWEDLQSLLDPMCSMLMSFRRTEQDNKQNPNATDANKASGNLNRGGIAHQVANLPLEFTISTVYILQAISSLKQSQNELLSAVEIKEFLDFSFGWGQQFLTQLTRFGFKEQHIVLMLKYSKLLQQVILKVEMKDLDSVKLIKRLLEQTALYLLKAQELLTAQVFFIGVHQESMQQAQISLPLLRLLGITKMRIAQINTTIGSIKSNLQQGGESIIKDKRKLDKIVSTFMDNITKQIDALSATYKKTMNRYEKSISILYSALNLIHVHCPEYSEALVEVTKNRRYLAMNKNHLRGQWRQDAIEVDEVNLQIANVEEGKDRKDMLAEKGLEGEVNDLFVDYKKEMIQSFVDLMNDATGSDDKEGVSTYERICNELGNDANVLRTFAQEFAEGRANLNKEQAFFLISTYQYAVSREALLKNYYSSTTDLSADLRRKRSIDLIKDGFSYYSSPCMPKQLRKVESDQLAQSKPTQILRANFSTDYLKENLASQTGYLSLQMSEDMSQMYVGYCQINRERKIQYYVSRIGISAEERKLLNDIKSQISQLKMNMQKSPITIDEDQIELEKQSELEIQQIMAQIEKFFSPITESLNELLHPERSMEPDTVPDAQVNQKGKGTAADKKADPKAKGAQPAKGKAPAKGATADLAAYESSLPFTTAGIESVVLCIDSRLENLPFESLSVFDKVPVTSRDFNLHLHMQRLIQVGHKADLHNNQGVAKEDIKYIVDMPDIAPLKSKSEALLKELPTLLPGSAINGILTHKSHLASVGEWQKQISQASMFAYFSMTCLLHQFPKDLVADLSIFNNCKSMVIFDRMNANKQLVDRSTITSKHYSPDTQPTQQIALFTLCGVSSIVINNWSTTPENNLDHFERVLRSSLTDGVYLGTAGLRKHYRHQDVKPKSIFASNLVTYGVPLLRII